MSCPVSPLYVGRGDVAAQAGELGRGLEETAREMRYAFLRETAAELGGALIATAHTADDNGETILLHLLRGSGLRGLTGIRPRGGRADPPHAHHHPGPGRGISVPLRTASCGRTAPTGTSPFPATACAGRWCRNWRTCAPASPDGRRRPQPCCGQTRTTSPAWRKRRWRTSSPRGGPSACPRQRWGLCLTLGPGRPGCCWPACGTEIPIWPPPIWGGWWPCAGGGTPLPGWICRRASPPDGSTRCWCSPGRLRPRHWRRHPLPMPGQLRTGEWTLTCAAAVYHGEPQSGQEFWLAGAEGLTVRPRRTGDRLERPGRPGRTVKKIMIDQKLPRHLRDTVPVLDSGGRVAAVAELGPDAAFLPRLGSPAGILRRKEKENISCWKRISRKYCFQRNSWPSG